MMEAHNFERESPIDALKQGPDVLEAHLSELVNLVVEKASCLNSDRIKTSLLCGLKNLLYGIQGR